MQMGRGPMKSACLVFLFLSAACLWSISDAHPHQLDGNAAVTKNINAVSSLELEGDHIEVVGPPTAIYDEEKVIGGRKVAVQKMMKLEKVKVKVDGEQSGIGKSKTVLSSSSNQLEGKSCGSDQVKWGTTHEECKHSTGTTRFSETSIDDQSGFVAFNEDYHPPRHHPPKNN